MRPPSNTNEWSIRNQPRLFFERHIKESVAWDWDLWRDSPLARARGRVVDALVPVRMDPAHSVERVVGEVNAAIYQGRLERLDAKTSPDVVAARTARDTVALLVEASPEQRTRARGRLQA